MLYPSAVQGEKASREIIAGIKYFNNLKINRPEVIIIARGGGSFEDLLPFNDEDLVREVFKSEIPIISAVGHETDFTLIDFVADIRAPTPTAGAEFATPVLEDLKINLRNLERNINNFVDNFFNKNQSALKNLERNLLSPQKFLENSQQKIINFSEKIEYSTKNFIENNFLKIQKIQILSPQKFLENSQQKIINFSEKIEYSTKNFIENNFLKIQKITIKSDLIFERIKIFKQKIFYDFDAIKKNIENNFIQKNIMIEGFANAIKSCNYQQMLERGFAVLKDKNNHLILNCEDLKNHQKFIITMQDGEVFANLSDNFKNQNLPLKKTDTQPNFFDLIEK
jgi:exodeoxyribonuclease VII large subunit